MPSARGHELLVTIEPELHGSARPERERGADVLEHDLLLDAEPSADPGLDDPHAPERKLVHARDDAADVERDLRARDDDEPVLLVEVGRRDVGLGRVRVDVVDAVSLNGHTTLLIRRQWAA